MPIPMYLNVDGESHIHGCSGIHYTFMITNLKWESNTTGSLLWFSNDSMILLFTEIILNLPLLSLKLYILPHYKAEMPTNHALIFVLSNQ